MNFLEMIFILLSQNNFDKAKKVVFRRIDLNIIL